MRVRRIDDVGLAHMRTFTIAELEQALDEVGVRSGQVLLVHSSLLSLGTLAGPPVTKMTAGIYDALRSRVGPEGTIVVPTFNFAFCNGALFDPQKTPSQKMGALSEYVRCQPEARRSLHPMQSVAAIGPLAPTICAPDTPSSFDPGGPFEVLLMADARVLLIGASIQAVSLVHWAEERALVPYRHWKTFSGPYRLHGAVTERSYRMYVRDLNLDPRLVLKRIEQVLVSEAHFNRARLGAGYLESFAARDFVEVALSRLREDPYWLVDKR
jgi:aminoglycoside N3'-acetyltransferase